MNNIFKQNTYRKSQIKILFERLKTYLALYKKLTVAYYIKEILPHYGKNYKILGTLLYLLQFTLRQSKKRQN